MNKSILVAVFAVGLNAMSVMGAQSILEIKNSITDDNIIAPESFETQTRLLEENFYLKNYVVPGIDLGASQTATPAEYEERLKRLPTEIELPYNSIVGNYINMYLTKRRSLVADMLALHSYYGPIFVEELLKGYPGLDTVHGRLDGTLPRDGELNPDLVAKALGLPVTEGAPVPEIVAPRPPALCNGCSHRDVYKALNEVIATYGEGRVFSDIGCYTLGALPPFQAINSCVDMGASITMAKGACDAGLFPVVSVIGDSTFTHSGMTGLLDAVNEKTPITVIISDNESISMTGGQDSSALGKIESICRGIGVEPEHIRVLLPVPKNHEELCRIIREELEYKGVSVIIPRRVCIQKAARDAKKNKK